MYVCGHTAGAAHSLHLRFAACFGVKVAANVTGPESSIVNLPWPDHKLHHDLSLCIGVNVLYPVSGILKGSIFVVIIYTLIEERAHGAQVDMLGII